MATKAGWICSAGSSGSASSLRRIRSVRALSRYAVARPVEQQIIDRRVGFDHDYNYRNRCWLVTSARVYCQCGCPIYWHIHEEMASDFFRKFTGKTRPCAQTILYRFRWQFQFRRLVLWARLIVGELICRRVGCRRIGLSATWFVGELTINLYTYTRKTTSITLPLLLGGPQVTVEQGPLRALLRHCMSYFRHNLGCILLNYKVSTNKYKGMYYCNAVYAAQLTKIKLLKQQNHSVVYA